MMSSQVKHVTAREMVAIEQNAKYLGVSTSQLMENAGSTVAMEVARRFKTEESTIVIMAGTGGKGGDGMVAARHLAGLGFNVNFILLGCQEGIRREAVKKNWEALCLMFESVKVSIVHDSSLIPALEGDVIIDALLGTGFRGSLHSPMLEGVNAINKASGFKLSIDIPTGVNPDTGDVIGGAVKADLTVTFHRSKTAVCRAKNFIGELFVAPIGIPPEAETYIGPGDVKLVTNPRSRESHKGDYGRLLILGGSADYHGAPTMAALAALRTGTDLVFTAVPEVVAPEVASASPALIVLKLKGRHLSSQNLTKLKDWLSKSSAVVLGPGLGLMEETQEAVKGVVEMVEERAIPLLLDADGLKAFSDFQRPLKCPLVLTPHAGEYQMLTGEELPSSFLDKVKHVENTAESLKAVLLLKGPVDIVTNGTRTKINRFVHNPGMTVGGTGDILSGIVGSLLSQGFEVFESASAGTFINGAAGDFAFKEKGYHLLPTDLLEWIPSVMNLPMNHISVRHL